MNLQQLSILRSITSMVGSVLSPNVTVCGEVIKGFGRGSKDLGIPTANFPESVVESLPSKIERGIYCGWAKVDNGEFHKCVETHIIHKFDEDFYGAQLEVCLKRYLREERNYDSKEELIKDIHGDIDNALSLLDDKFSQ